MAKQVSELEQVKNKIDFIRGFSTSTEIEIIKLLRLIATEQAKIIDLLK
ncbi:hypothetical protein [Pseudobutyrivibrio sp.]